MKRTRKYENAEKLLDQLLDEPHLAIDMDEGDLLSGTDKLSIREALLERLSRDADVTVFSVASDLFGRLGIGKAKGGLARIASDPSSQRSARAAAGMILMELEPELADRILAKLSPAERSMIELAPVRYLLATLIHHPTALDPVTAYLESSETLSPFYQVEAVRRELGLYPLEVYEDILFGAGTEEMRDIVFQLLVDYEDPDAIEYLTFIRDHGGDESVDWQELIDRVEAVRQSRPPADPPPAQAWLAPPLFPSTGELMLAVENPEGTSSFGAIAFDPFAEDTHDPFVNYDPPADLLSNLETDPIRPIDPGVARALFEPIFDDIIDANEDGSSTGWIAFYHLARRVPLVDPPRPHATPASVSPAQVEELFDEGPYRKWVFPPEHVVSLAGEPDSMEDPSEEWLEASVAGLDATSDRTRVAEALRVMAHWHMAGGEEDRAALAEAVAEGIDAEGLSFAEVGKLILRRMFSGIAGVLAEEAAWEVEPDEEQELLRILKPVLAKHLRDPETAFVSETLDRLRDEGMSAREAKRAIALELGAEIKRMAALEHDFDEAAYASRLDRLRGPRA